MHLEGTELGESNLFLHVDSPGFVSCHQPDCKITFRKPHHKSIREGEKFMKVMNNPGNPCNPSLVSRAALEYSL